MIVSTSISRTRRTFALRSRLQPERDICGRAAKLIRREQHTAFEYVLDMEMGDFGLHGSQLGFDSSQRRAAVA